MPRGKPTWSIVVWRRRHATPMVGWRAAISRFWNRVGVCSLDTADGASVLAFVESYVAQMGDNVAVLGVSNFRPFLTFARRADLVDAGQPGRRETVAHDPAGSGVTTTNGWSARRVRRG